MRRGTRARRQVQSFRGTGADHDVTWALWRTMQRVEVRIEPMECERLASTATRTEGEQPSQQAQGMKTPTLHKWGQPRAREAREKLRRAGHREGTPQKADPKQQQREEEKRGRSRPEKRKAGEDGGRGRGRPRQDQRGMVKKPTNDARRGTAPLRWPWPPRGSGGGIEPEQPPPPNGKGGPGRSSPQGGEGGIRPPPHGAGRPRPPPYGAGRPGAAPQEEGAAGGGGKETT